MRKAIETPGLISLAAGFVDQESLPAAAIAAVIARLTEDREEGLRALQYGTTQGDPGLRAAADRTTGTKEPRPALLRRARRGRLDRGRAAAGPRAGGVSRPRRLSGLAAE